MARNLNHLRRQSGMSKEEWDYFMQTGNAPQNMSFEDAASLRQQRDAFNTEAYDESVADYEGGDVGGYVPPEDQQDFERTGYGNQPGATDIQDVGGYQGQIQDVGEYTPAEGSVGGEGPNEFEQAQKDYYSDESIKQREEDKDSVDYAGGAQGEQGNMYMQGVTDDMRRGDYKTDEEFQEALIRARHSAGHPNPYNNMQGSQFYLDTAKTHYVGKDVLDTVDPYNLFPNIKANQPDVNQAVFAGAALGENNANVRVVQNADGTTSTVLVNPGEEAVLSEGQQPYVAPEDQEDEWASHQPTGYGDFPGTPKQPVPLGGPPAHMPNPMRNRMNENPMANFGLLTPGTPNRANIPRALPTSDELN